MTDDEILAAIEALIAEAERDTAVALQEVFGPVPAWVPRPILADRQRIARNLFADGTDPNKIRRRIDEILSGKDMSEAASPPMSYVRAVDALAGFLYAVSLGERDGLRELAGDQADLGQRFKQGRKVGTVGPVRQAVARLLKKTPDMKTSALWAAVSKKPPRGWEAFDNSQGKYLEGPKSENVGYRRFQNICTDERQRVNAKITG